MKGRNVNWSLTRDSNGKFSMEQATLLTLMDIREELRDLNRVFRCSRFLDVPSKLDRIEKNTRKTARKKPTQ